MDILSAPFHIFILAGFQLSAGHTYYFVRCGLGVRLLRLLSGPVRKPYILHMYCKSGKCFFYFPFFLCNYTSWTEDFFHLSDFFLYLHDLYKKTIT